MGDAAEEAGLLAAAGSTVRCDQAVMDLTGHPPSDNTPEGEDPCEGQGRVLGLEGCSHDMKACIS